MAGAAAICAALGATGGLAAGPAPPVPRRPSTVHPARVRELEQVTVTVARRAASAPVPRSFLGISTEYGGVNLFGRFMGDFAHVVSLLQVPGDGPLVLRIGGDSADHSVLGLNSLRLPTGVFDVRPRWFRRVSALVQALHARLIFDLNLVADTPAMAVRWARAAMADLPRGSLLDYEVGNEPDLYVRRYWTSVFSPFAPLVKALPSELAPPAYVSLFSAASRVLSRVSPRVGLAGPAVAYPRLALGWITALLRSPHRHLALVTGHEYPYSACAPRLSARFPTIGRLLSDGAAAGIAQAVRPAVLLAHRAGLPFRLTELNSVTCEGRAGVSNSFATALWAPDALFELLRAGVDGVNIHVRAHAVNGAFGVGARGLVPHPLLYGMVLFTRMLGPDARLVHVRLSAPRWLHVKAWAVRTGWHDLRVLVINKGSVSVRAALHLPGTGAAAVERLLAPSPATTSGETLDGQRLSASGAWRGRAATEWATRAGGRYELNVPPASAALVRVQTEARVR